MAPALGTLPSAPVRRGVNKRINSDADGRKRLEGLVSGLGSLLCFSSAFRRSRNSARNSLLLLFLQEVAKLFFLSLLLFPSKLFLVLLLQFNHAHKFPAICSSSSCCLADALVASHS